jgi:hypothetical protein
MQKRKIDQRFDSPEHAVETSKEKDDFEQESSRIVFFTKPRMRFEPHMHSLIMRRSFTLVDQAILEEGRQGEDSCEVPVVACSLGSLHSNTETRMKDVPHGMSSFMILFTYQSYHISVTNTCAFHSGVMQSLVH